MASYIHGLTEGIFLYITLCFLFSFVSKILNAYSAYRAHGMSICKYLYSVWKELILQSVFNFFLLFAKVGRMASPVLCY
jgi:hypothetical protein